MTGTEEQLENEWDVVLNVARQQGDKDELLKEAASFLEEQQLTPMNMRGNW